MRRLFPIVLLPLAACMQTTDADPYADPAYGVAWDVCQTHGPDMVPAEYGNIQMRPADPSRPMVRYSIINDDHCRI